MRDDRVVGKAGDSFLGAGKARGSSAGRDIIARGSHGGMRCVGAHLKGGVCASLCAASQKAPRFHFNTCFLLFHLHVF